MTDQKCPSCSEPMRVINNADGTDSFVCEYCGSVINNRPKTTSDKVFAFINRAINALKEDETKLTPEQQAAREAVNERNALIHHQYLEKRMREAQKRLDKQKRKMGIK